MIQYTRGRIGEDRSTILDMGRVPDHGTGLKAPLAGQEGAPGLPEYSPVTSEDDEPALKRPKGDSTVIDGGSFSPMTGPDQDSPVGGIKTEAQAGEMDMAKVAARLTDRQWTTELLRCSGRGLPHRRAISETEVQAPTTSTSSNAYSATGTARSGMMVVSPQGGAHAIVYKKACVLTQQTKT